ncbi:IS3 family transposase [Weissella minor]|uniref:IS3 family transposase n=1 Tax=Weissella minor TaxID=1620 RepID=UPI0009F97BF8
MYASYNKFKKQFESFIQYYNNDRIKEKLGGLTPIEYRRRATEKMSGFFVQPNGFTLKDAELFNCLM